jgi:hypothetical protein
MVEDSWEARMAERARERREKNTPAPGSGPPPPDDDTLCVDRPWLHGWPRINRGRAVLMGTGVHCVCCGRLQGVTTVAFDPDWVSPPDPVWPFDIADCPLCAPFPPYTP